MEVGVYIPGHSWPHPAFRDAFVEAERLGFDAGWTMDNSVGAMETIRELPVPDTWTVLPAIAEATSRIRLGPLVTPVGRRPFALLAKTTHAAGESALDRANQADALPPSRRRTAGPAKSVASGRRPTASGS